MGIFDRFPYSSTHEMNLDFMLGKATEIAESLQEIDTHKDQAEQAATNAAQSAQNAAQAAQAASGSQTAAGMSASQAAQHKADAEDAADRAEAASNLADEAVEQAQTAVTQAQTAATNASTAADGAIASAAAAETRINNLAASLPEDFTELNNKVTGLKSAISELPKYKLSGFDVKTESYTPQWPEGGKIEFDSNIGYIAKTDGQVKNAGTGTWIYSDFIPLSRLDGTVGNFNLHDSVACVSYYSEANFNSWLGHLSITSEYDQTYSKSDVLNNAPNGSAFIVICTDGSKNKLYAYLTAEPSYTETVINLPVFGKKIMHISFDDTNNAFKDLTDNASTYSSIFDSPFFAVLKEMHDTYGAVFSCYCFYNVYTDENKTTLVFSLSNATNKFLNEFKENSDWLRFGFHSIDNYKTYLNATETEAKTDWNTFINTMIGIVGMDSIDTIVRLQSFEANQNACRGFRNALCGARGFLCSDYSETETNKNIDTSTGYYLTSNATTICGRMGKYFDSAEDLYFFPSNWRIDWQPDIAEWLALFNTPDRFNRRRYMIMYGHENTMTSSSGNISAYRTKLITVCNWAKENGYLFVFPADMINY